MKDNKINAVIAITTLVGAILMALALSFAIGKWLASANPAIIFLSSFPTCHRGSARTARSSMPGPMSGESRKSGVIPPR